MTRITFPGGEASKTSSELLTTVRECVTAHEDDLYGNPSALQAPAFAALDVLAERLEELEQENHLLGANVVDQAARVEELERVLREIVAMSEGIFDVRKPYYADAREIARAALRDEEQA